MEEGSAVIGQKGRGRRRIIVVMCICLQSGRSCRNKGPLIPLENCLAFQAFGQQSPETMPRIDGRGFKKGTGLSLENLRAKHLVRRTIFIDERSINRRSMTVCQREPHNFVRK